MSRKKILLATRPIVPPWDEASKNFAYFLAKNIKNAKLEIHLLTPKKAPSLEKDLSSNIIQKPIYSQTDFSRAGYPLSQKLLLTHYLFTHTSDYDIVHYLFTPTILNAIIIKFSNWLQRKTFKTIQTIATLREDLHTPDQWKRMFFADKLVTYSDYSKNRLEKAGFQNITRIYPGIDLNLYAPKPKNEEALKHFALTSNDFVVMYPGEYVRLGATDMLVDMLIKYCHSHKNILFIFGCRVKNDADQKKKDAIVAQLTQAKVIDRVRFTDTWKDMPTLYNLSDIVVFPVENMRGKFDVPLAIIEAYACGKPVILSDLPIFQEFSKPEFSAIIPKGDGEALWTKIEELQSDEAKRKSLGIHARLFVEQHFDVQNTAREYEELYKEL